MKLSMDDLAFRIRYCRISKCYKKKGEEHFWKIHNHVRHEQLDPEAYQGLVKLGGQRNSGIPPRGELARGGDVSRGNTQRVEEGPPSRGRASAKSGPSSGSRAPGRSPHGSENGPHLGVNLVVGAIPKDSHIVMLPQLLGSFASCCRDVVASGFLHARGVQARRNLVDCALVWPAMGRGLPLRIAGVRLKRSGVERSVFMLCVSL